MPFCTLTTNLSSQDISEDFHTTVTQKLADFLEKPFSKMTMVLHSDKRMLVNGSKTPDSLFIDIWAMRPFPLEMTEATLSGMRTYINRELGIEKERIWCIFHELKSEQAGLASIPV